MNMPSNKSPGHDKVSMRVIKTCLPHILPVVTDLINSSFTEGCFPKVWKSAEVVSHLKDGDHELASNNRPISLLPVLSKVGERIAHEQFVQYLTSTNKFSAHQSGNKKLHSTETLGVLFTSELYKAIDERKVTAVILIDLSKAFDSIHHETLLNKLCGLGVSDDALKWFTSYLSNREQRTRIDNTLSSLLVVKQGVPQGANRLLINPDKTKFCVFGSSQMLKRTIIPSITFLGKELTTMASVKDLGIVLDNHLSFNEHISILVSDLMGKLCMINRVRHLLDQSTLLIVINCLVFSKLFYCSSVWSGTSKGNVAKLQLVQNFAARILSDKSKFDHITPTLKELNLLPISDLLYLRDATLTFKCMNGLVPPYLSTMFTLRSEVHNRSTRNCDKLQIPKCRTTLAQQAFYYRAVQIWNSLPKDITDLNSIKRFKHELKSRLTLSWKATV